MWNASIFRSAGRPKPCGAIFDPATKKSQLARIEEQIASPDFWNQPEKSQKLLQERKRLEEALERDSQIARMTSDLETLLELYREGEPVQEDIETEMRRLREQLAQLESEMLLSGENDRRNAIVTIHPGAGGLESQDWAEMLLRMYLRWAERKGFETEILDLTEGEEAGIKSATVEVRGPYAYGYLKSERGVHRLVRLSPFNSAATRQTSFAKVEVMPEVDEVGEIEIDPDDLKIDVFRSSGAGGQNVQKNSTAVRITHIPTGIVVTCQNERSQAQNKESAMKVLEARLLELELNRQEEEKARLKGEHVDVSFGSQVRNYVLHPYKLVKDLRTGYETTDTTAVLDGEIDPFIEAYLRAQVGQEEA
ncbi:MAG: peptide chain release factor 2 [Dehalococcoidia bacterium]|nr:peptide chain release factor 2 [Dehalococcoidia bacterium]